MSGASNAAGGKGDSVLARARQFFADNPDEVLHRADIELKFGCCRRTAGTVARSLIAERVVTRDQLPRQVRPSRANADAKSQLKSSEAT